jgi:DNA modification methylase
MLYLGDCIEVLKTPPDNSVDSVVTDPPYELGFMGKSWDNKGIAYSVDMWREVLRVLKPGGHLLSFGGTRTYHRMACAIEDAGFEIRDQMQWLYGSGFPKSYNISKGIDKMAGAEREILGESPYNARRPNPPVSIFAQAGYKENITAPSTPFAIQWDGWGSALKPANEPICVARKPLSEKNLVENVLKWGTGGINIDGCRIDGIPPSVPNPILNSPTGKIYGFKTGKGRNGEMSKSSGRFPANLILDEEAGQMLNEISSPNMHRAGNKNKSSCTISKEQVFSGGWKTEIKNPDYYPGTGGASRFFYCAKASRSERNAGLEGMEESKMLWSSGTQNPGSFQSPNTHRAAQNYHPTVKPISLMRYLCRLVTPPKGIVLDPFMGSGTTGCAASLEGFEFIGIEREPEYMEIAERRIAYYQKQPSLL